MNIKITDRNGVTLKTANTFVKEDIAVAVDLPQQEKSVTPTKSVQEVVADSDYDGLIKVTVGAIPDEYIVPSGELDITENGTKDVTNYTSANVNVQPTLQEKEVTENGEYVADEGYDGFSKVTVNVAGEDMLQQYVDANGSCNSLFAKFKGNNIDFIKDLDISNIADVSYMFSDSTKIETIPLLNLSGATNIAGMFARCSKLKTIPQLVLSKVNASSSVFENCIALETIPPLNISTATLTSNMFYNCYNLITIQLLDIKNVGQASNMFYNCQKLTNLTLLNIKVNLIIGSSSSYGHLLTLESLLNTCQECINVGSARTLTVGSANSTKLQSVYVKLTGEDEEIASLPKLPMVQCEPTDEGAMPITDYMALKNWTTDIVFVPIETGYTATLTNVGSNAIDPVQYKINGGEYQSITSSPTTLNNVTNITFTVTEENKTAQVWDSGSSSIQILSYGNELSFDLTSDMSFEFAVVTGGGAD